MKSFFEAKIWPLRNKLYRMALLWLKDRDSANDAVQEAMTKGFVHSSKLATLINPTGWMVRTLKNEVYQKLNEARRWEKLEGLEISHPAVEDEKENISHTIRWVFRFLENLPEKQQEVFFLREVEGLTYREIAVYLEISEEQVKINLHRTRKKLKTYLSTHERSIG
jgi:RNA polymerase sigma factor (sigma-70 family)